MVNGLPQGRSALPGTEKGSERRGGDKGGGHRACPRGSPGPPAHCFLHAIPDWDWSMGGGVVNTLQPIASAASHCLRNRRRSPRGTRQKEAEEKPGGQQGLRGRAASCRGPQRSKKRGAVEKGARGGQRPGCLPPSVRPDAARLGFPGCRREMPPPPRARDTPMPKARARA